MSRRSFLQSIAAVCAAQFVGKVAAEKAESFMLPGVNCWYRFQTGITTLGGGLISWEDQSGNGNDLYGPVEMLAPENRP